MKIKNINTMEGFENKEAYIQYLLMNNNVSKIQKALDSLENPLSVTEALETANSLIENNNKISSILSTLDKEDRDAIVLNILLSSFMNNNEFSKELELFVRKKSPVIAGAKVETGMTIAKFANKVYKPETEENNDLLVA